MWTAILTIIGAVASLWYLYAKRRNVPTTEEKLDDLEDEYVATTKKIHELRAAGNHAEADAILRRLNQLAIPVGMRKFSPHPHFRDDPFGERLGNDAPTGKPSDRGGKDGVGTSIQ